MICSEKQLNKAIALSMPDEKWQIAMVQILNHPDLRNSDGLDKAGSGLTLISICYMMQTLIGKKRFSFKSKMPSVSKKYCQLQGELMAEIFVMVSQVWALNDCGYSHPSVWFAHLILQREILGFGWCEEFGGSQPTGKKDMLAFVGNQNKMLRGFSNPFTTSAAQKLISHAAEYAQGEGTFNSRFYRPFVQARQKFITVARLQPTYIETLGGVQQCRQGRAKKLIA